MTHPLLAMKINLIAVGNKMPKWVDEACSTYIKRLSSNINFQLIQIPLAKRHKKDLTDSAMDAECELILKQIPKGSLVIALELTGTNWHSDELANFLKESTLNYPTLTFLIGGPDGLSQACLNRAEKKWSLSNLTLPHPLARIMVCEALYRASTIIDGHPYHRA